MHEINAKCYSKDRKANVQYYRILLHTCTKFPLQLVEFSYSCRFVLDNLKKIIINNDFTLEKKNNFLSSFFEWYFPHKSMNVLCAFLILFFSYYYSGNKTAGKMDFIFTVVNNQVNWLNTSLNIICIYCNFPVSTVLHKDPAVGISEFYAHLRPKLKILHSWEFFSCAM